MRKKSWPEAIHYNRSEKKLENVFCVALYCGLESCHIFFAFSSTSTELTEWCAHQRPPESKNLNTRQKHTF